MAEVAIRNVIKNYGATRVIHGVSIDVADGEFIVIVGPSGCGKSTLLRMVAGLEEITEGEIAIKGTVVNNLEPKDRDIAMVFQNYALYPHMSVFDNMAYGLKIAGMSKQEIGERVAKAARMLELSELLERRPRQLSGGQRQRVAMGRAVVRDPAVFLFDEPLSNLDAKLRVQMRLEIRKLQRSLGTTALYVTHDQVEAMTLADRLIVMNAGVAEQVDTPLTVYEHPASLFVAGFIGSPAMNFLSCRVSADGTNVELAPGVTIKGEDKPLPAPPGTAVTAGVRPEHLEIAREADPDITLTAEMTETLGADTLVHGRIAGMESAEEAVISEGGHGLVSIRLPGHERPKSGDKLPLRAVPGMLHLFDSETGKRILDL